MAALAVCSSAAHAVTISPVVVDLSPARRIASITITNPGERAISFQTATLAWTQPDGVDRYDETDELVVVPPIAEIAAGGSQIFRVTMRAPPSPDEHAYRLVFEDVTEAAAPSSDEVAVNVRVNHNLPVFVAVGGKPRAEPRIGPCTTSVSAMSGCVRLDNDGNRYLQVKSLTVESGSWRKHLKTTRVLAGAWRQWTFDLPAQLTEALRVIAETSDGLVMFQFPIPAR